MEKNPTICRKIDRVVQSDEFIKQDSRYYNVSVLIYHHQDFKKLISSVVGITIDV